MPEESLPVWICHCKQQRLHTGRLFPVSSFWRNTLLFHIIVVKYREKYRKNEEKR